MTRRIYANTDATCRRHSVFQCGEEVFIEILLLFSRLRLQTFALNNWVIQFAVTGRNFLSANDQFENINRGRISRCLSRQWHKFRRQMCDKKRIAGFGFHEFFKNLIGDFEVFHRGGNFDAQFSATLTTFFHSDRKPVFTSCTFDEFAS